MLLTLKIIYETAVEFFFDKIGYPKEVQGLVFLLIIESSIHIKIR
jgi:hypothetical protein